MTSAFSWQNSISLCPASFRIPASKVRGGDERSYPTSEVRASGQEEIPHAPSPRPGAVSGRSYPRRLSPRPGAAA